MRKNLLSILLTLLCSVYFQFASSQSSESFHLIKYSPPANWSFSQNEGYKQYMFFDSLKNDYCIITIYAALTSSGNVRTDFSEEWAARVLAIATAPGKPKIENTNLTQDP